MKKFLIHIGLFALLLTSFSSCKDDLEEQYTNPELSEDPNVPGFFTGMLNNDRVRPAYWNVRTFLLPHTAVYTQTAGFVNSNTVYQHNDGYLGDYWSDFYRANGGVSGVMALYRLMEVAYDEMSEEEKAENEIFMQAGRIVLFDHASKMVDLWGDVPFSEAGSLETTGQINDPKFDDQTELYETFLTGLQEAAEYFSSVDKPEAFNTYDILLSGDTGRWRRYANSLRLRLLMRISNADESRARTEISEMLGDPDQYPLLDGNNNGSYDPGSSDVLLQPLTTYTDDLNSALTEISSFWAPDYMLNTAMLPADDPRIPVIFDKYGETVDGEFIPNEEYGAMPVTFNQSQQESNFALYSILDSATFLQNNKLPGIVITAPEVNFLKAEAYERWGSGDAQAAYETAVRQSIQFYYYLNSINRERFDPLPVPSEEATATFLEQPAIAWTGSSDEKLEKLYIQKWLHLGFLQSIEAWSEYRRTGYPELQFPSGGKLSGYENPPVRLMYPSVETGFNSHYPDVQSENTRDTRVFWDVN